MSDRKIISRNLSFNAKIITHIWDEKASEENPYIASSVRCHGYDLFELMEKRSFLDVLFLLFQGELPTVEQGEILEKMMIGLINPGPRHPATRAAMYAGVGKTHTQHILPISLSILSGNHLGAGIIEDCIRFFRKETRSDPRMLADFFLKSNEKPKEGDWHPAPGFGSRFGGIDMVPNKIADYLSALPAAGKALSWGRIFAAALQPQGVGWLSTGVAAAVLSDLGFRPRAGAGLFQIISAPGLLAHGLEVANKQITALPFPADDHYKIEED